MVDITTFPPATRFIVWSDESAALAVPFSEPHRARITNDIAVLWLGPSEWLLLAPADWRPPRITATMVDISHRHVALEVSGPNADAALNAYCALDLHPSAFPIGMCTRTVFAKAEIVLWRTDANTFRIEVARSYAPYVRACLDLAALP
jgi:heterotetrameric sarcosine oxidase gamma subunit